MIPSPAGCLLTMETSPEPLTTYVMLASKPLCEKTQISAVSVPLAGRVNVTGLPASVQELFTTLNAPSARGSRFHNDNVIPALGVLLASETTASETFGAAITRDTVLELVPSGLRTNTRNVAGKCHVRGRNRRGALDDTAARRCSCCAADKQH
jgi:hypothetical protein